MNPREEIETSLQKALEYEESGERSAPPFADDPELMAELAPLLEVVETLRASALPAPEPSPIARAAARNRFLIAVHHHRLRASLSARVLRRLQDMWASRYHWLYEGIWPTARRWAPAMIGVLLAIILSSRAYYASADSLPGDTLYPVKRVAEQVQLLTTLNADAKARLRAQFNDRRLSETQQLLQGSRVEEVQFQGIIEEVFPDRLRINGLIVRLEGSHVGGAPAVGATALVTAITQPSQELLAITVSVIEEAPAEPTATPPKRAPTPTRRRVPPVRTQGGGYATRVPTRAPQPTSQPTAPSLPAADAAITATLVAPLELTPLAGTPAETATGAPLDAVTAAPTATGQPATPTPIPSETPSAPTVEPTLLATPAEPTATSAPELPTSVPTEPSAPLATPSPAPTAEPPTLEPPPPTAAPEPSATIEPPTAIPTAAPTAEPPPQPPTATPAPPAAPTAELPPTALPEPPTSAPPTAAPPTVPPPEPPTPAPEERSL